MCAHSLVAQLLAVLLVVFSVLAPMCIAAFMDSAPLVSIISFFVLLGYVALNETARELEQVGEGEGSVTVTVTATVTVRFVPPSTRLHESTSRCGGTTTMHLRSCGEGVGRASCGEGGRGGAVRTHGALLSSLSSQGVAYVFPSTCLGSLHLPLTPSTCL